MEGGTPEEKEDNEIMNESNHNEKKKKHKKRKHRKGKDDDSDSDKKTIDKKNPAMVKDFIAESFVLLHIIGKGSFGQIFMVTDNINKKYALKKIIASSEKEIKSLKQEYQILFDIKTNIN